MLARAVCILLLLVPSAAFAFDVHFSGLTLSTMLLLVCLLGGIVFGILVGIKKVRPVLFISAWSLITLVAWLFLFIAVTLLSEHLGDDIAILVGDTAVIVAEAIALRKLVLSSSIMKEAVALSFPKSLLISAIGNVASMAGGILIFLLVQSL